MPPPTDVTPPPPAGSLFSVTSVRRSRSSPELLMPPPKTDDSLFRTTLSTMSTVACRLPWASLPFWRSSAQADLSELHASSAEGRDGEDLRRRDRQVAVLHSGRGSGDSVA